MAASTASGMTVGPGMARNSRPAATGHCGALCCVRSKMRRFAGFTSTSARRVGSRMFMAAIKRCAGPPRRGQAPAPVFFVRRRDRLSSLGPSQKCEGVERRKAQPLILPPAPFRAAAGRARNAGRVAFRHSTAAISVPRVRVSWDEAFRPVHSPAGSLRKGHSAPRSGPEASRERGYEPRARAPHHPRVMQRPAGRPSRGGGLVNI